MIRRFFTLIGTVGILIGGFALIGLLGQMRPEVETSEPQLVAPVVFYEVAESTSVTLDVQAQGEVRPRTDINLTAQVAGQIVSTAAQFVNGGAFDKGDVLIKIEDAPYRAAAAAAGARLAQEEAEAALARKDYEDLGRAEDPTALALRLPQLEQARAENRAAQLDLERTTIRAPFEGRVRERLAGVGQYVAPGAQLGRIFSTDVAEIRLPLTDNDLAMLGLPIAFVESEDAPGPAVTLTAVIAGQPYQWTGRIARTDGAIDPTTRQIFAIAVVDDPYGEAANAGAPLAMGLFVNAVIQGKPFSNAIVLPRSALHGRDVVYVVGADDVLAARQIQVVATDRDTITIAGGVSPGERIVTSPLRGAGDGDEVSPEQAQPSALNVNFVAPLDVAASDDNIVEEIAPVEPTDLSADVATAEIPSESGAVETPAPEKIFAGVDEDDRTIAPTPASLKVETSADDSALAKQYYRPGETAPNDEIADDLNARQRQFAAGVAENDAAAEKTGEQR